MTLPKQYVDFLLEYNGGYPQESIFKISDDEGESLVNKVYGIGDMKSNLAKVFEILEGEIPDGFVSIANDPGGNEILLGVSGEYQGKVYFWIHDIEPEDEMGNMFILADSFAEFLNNLYDSE
ncbi:SMI1/KNR4 family protein [Peribacillus frigoritolerans]|uniref:SMI1/KNR4 family protein n=1 Tax=Peribacillus frigoritolerans TaxID=450367 RepID=UPI0032B49EF1